MNTKIIYSLVLSFAISGCGSSSENKKSDGAPITDQTIEADVLTDTRVCDDSTKILNMSAVFEATFGAKDSQSRIVERFRLEETNVGSGTMTIQLSCATSENGVQTTATAKVQYKRTANSIETLEDVEASTVHDPNDQLGCSVNLKFAKTTFLITPKNSCLILNQSGSNSKSVIFVPSKIEI